MPFVLLSTLIVCHEKSRLASLFCILLVKMGEAAPAVWILEIITMLGLDLDGVGRGVLTAPLRITFW